MAGRKIFICYRREDSAGHAGRLYDRLNLRFPGRVFMDVAGIGLGTRWAEVIEQSLDSCEVALLLIGRRWLEQASDGSRRIDNPDDPLRAEIVTALKLNLTLVPVLVGGATMPSREDLPADIAAVADWQAMRVDDDDFDHDATRLVQSLERQLTDKGVDPHLEETAARRRQVEALFREAATASAAGQWVTAAQTLRAILSLEPTNQHALIELRDVERRAALAHGQAGGTGAVTGTGSGGRSGRWALFGVLGAVALVAVGGFVVLVFVLIALSGVEPDASNTLHDQGVPAVISEPDDPYDEPSAPQPVQPAPGAQAASPHQQLIGQYLLADYRQQGMRLPFTGRLVLTDAGQGRLRFETQSSNQVTGEGYWYRGVLQQQSGVWTTTTTESNDPEAVAFPIETALSFDGRTLSTSNAYGEAAVWQKQ